MRPVVAPTVAVFAGHTTSDVNIHFGPRTGVLRGTVLDNHERPIITARLVVYPEDDPALTPSMSVRDGATFVLALPDRFYTLTIDAPGFDQWSSEIAGELPTHHVRLEPNEARRLVVHLR